MVIGSVCVTALIVAWRIGGSGNVLATQHLATQFQLLISAVGLSLTFALVSITAFYAWQTRVMVREMKLAREKDVEQRRTAQAERIAAWLQSGAGKFHERDAGVWRYSVNAMLKNSSDVPVYDVIVTARSDEVDGIPPLGAEIRLGVLDPQHQRSVQVPLGDVAYRPDILQPDIDADRITLEIEFRDSAGHRWRRDPLGVLREVHDR